MEQEFTVSNWMKLLYCALGLILLGLAVAIFVNPTSLSAPFIVFPLLLMIGGISILLNAFRRKIVISNNILTYTNLFYIKEISVDNIRGYRFGRKVLYLEATSPEKATIIIRNYNDFANTADLLAWVKGNFNDLDATDLEDEKSRLAQDTALGFTPEERQQKIDNAKKIALVYNIIGAVIGIVNLVTDVPLLTIISIVYPLLCVPIIMTGNGLIKFISNIKRSVYPFLIIGFAVPAMVLLGKALGSHHLFNTDNLWVPLVAVSLIVFALLFRVGGSKSIGVVEQAAIFVFISIFYAAGSIVEINCEFDNAPVKVYHAAVLGHHISRGRNTSYYLYLTKWGPDNKQEQVSVGSKMYYNTNVGDTVNINFKPGLLNVPWFVVKK